MLVFSEYCFGCVLLLRKLNSEQRCHLEFLFIFLQIICIALEIIYKVAE